MIDTSWKKMEILMKEWETNNLHNFLSSGDLSKSLSQSPEGFLKDVLWEDSADYLMIERFVWKYR